MLFLILVNKNWFNKDNKDTILKEYKDNKDTILKEYKDIIIAIKNKPNINIDNIIYLTNLKDLISIAINNNINIFNYQNNYYTIIENTYYMYILKNIKT